MAMHLESHESTATRAYLYARPCIGARRSARAHTDHKIDRFLVRHYVPEAVAGYDDEVLATKYPFVSVVN